MHGTVPFSITMFYCINWAIIVSHLHSGLNNCTQNHTRLLGFRRGFENEPAGTMPLSPDPNVALMTKSAKQDKYNQMCLGLCSISRQGKITIPAQHWCRQRNHSESSLWFTNGVVQPKGNFAKNRQAAELMFKPLLTIWISPQMDVPDQLKSWNPQISRCFLLGFCASETKNTNTQKTLKLIGDRLCWLQDLMRLNLATTFFTQRQNSFVFKPILSVIRKSGLHVSFDPDFPAVPGAGKLTKEKRPLPSCDFSWVK